MPGFGSDVAESAKTTNGENNIISGASSGNSFAGIVNGENNNITIHVDNPVSGQVYNTTLFGSNLTAVTKDYSHFENLYVDETLYSRNTYSISPTVASSAITIDGTYSFYYINGDADAYLDEIAILLETPKVDLQFLSIAISKAAGLNLNNIYFVDEIGGFSSRQTTTPTQIAAKDGANAGTNRMITNLASGNFVAYFFIWSNTINKWVMFMADEVNPF